MMKYIVDVPGKLPESGCLAKAKRLGDVLDIVCSKYCTYRRIYQNYGMSEANMESCCAECPTHDIADAFGGGK